MQVRRRAVQTPGQAGAARSRLRALVAATATAVLFASTVPAATADKNDRAYPSKEEVAAAQQRVGQKSRAVGAIQASLLLANQRLEQAALEAEMASEAYNGAMWRLQEATQQVRDAQADVRQARATVEEQRRAIGALVAASYQQGSELTALSAMMGADGPEGVLDQYAAFQGASDSLQADYDRFAASDALAQAFERKAEEARTEQQRLAEEAREAKDAAEASAAQAQAAASEIATEKQRLIRELAEAQDISVRLATKRQTALEEIARERAEERARAEAEAAAREKARQEERAAAEARADARARAKAAARAERRRNRQKDNAAPAPAPQPEPAPSPAPPPAPSGSGGADRAIDFARAQLGEEYVWGAAGPDSWDCSGLMLGAWGAAGVYLPHYSAAQYDAGTPISSSELRPGDLVFWGTSSDPASIHHVAMYIGNGQIIHAPRTGRPVSIDSMYYWTPPNFFARV